MPPPWALAGTALLGGCALDPVGDADDTDERSDQCVPDPVPDDYAEIARRLDGLSDIDTVARGAGGAIVGADEDWIQLSLGDSSGTLTPQVRLTGRPGLTVCMFFPYYGQDVTCGSGTFTRRHDGTSGCCDWDPHELTLSETTIKGQDDGERYVRANIDYTFDWDGWNTSFSDDSTELLVRVFRRAEDGPDATCRDYSLAIRARDEDKPPQDEGSDDRGDGF